MSPKLHLYCLYSVSSYRLVLMSSFRFTPHAANKMRQAIHDAGGVEVFAIGDVNEEGMVYDLEIHCRGNEGSTPFHFLDTILDKL